MIVDYSHIVALIIGVFIGLLIRDAYNFIKNKLKYRKDTREIPIKLEFKNAGNEKELLELKYSVLLVKYGKDEVVKAEKLLSKE